MGLIRVIDCEIRGLTQALAVDPDSIEARRDLAACERIRAGLVLAVQLSPSRPKSRLTLSSFPFLDSAPSARRLPEPPEGRRCAAGSSRKLYGFPT